MSIDVEKTNALVEKVDVISNLIEQMFLQHMINDTIAFKESYAKASKLCFDISLQLENEVANDDQD